MGDGPWLRISRYWNLLLTSALRHVHVEWAQLEILPHRRLEWIDLHGLYRDYIQEWSNWIDMGVFWWPLYRWSRFIWPNLIHWRTHSRRSRSFWFWLLMVGFRFNNTSAPQWEPIIRIQWLLLVVQRCRNKRNCNKLSLLPWIDFCRNYTAIRCWWWVCYRILQPLK